MFIIWRVLGGLFREGWKGWCLRPRTQPLSSHPILGANKHSNPQEPLGLLETKPKRKNGTSLRTLSNDGGWLSTMKTGSPNGRLTDVGPVNHLIHTVEGQSNDDFILEMQTSGESGPPTSIWVTSDGGNLSCAYRHFDTFFYEGSSSLLSI